MHARDRAQRSDARPRVDESALPHNLDAEQSILGGILLQPAVLRDLAELTPDDFFDLRNKVVFAAMRALEAAGKPIDVVTVELEIEKFDRTYETNKLDAIGGVGYLGVLAGRCPTANNVVEYAETVRLLHRHRQAQVALISALDRARHDVIAIHDRRFAGKDDQARAVSLLTVQCFRQHHFARFILQ